METKGLYYQHPNHEIIRGLLCQYFDKYVPNSGACETEGGELVRAMNRIIYRWENDGDRLMEDYGRETCNPSARAIISKLEDLDIDTELLNIRDIILDGYCDETDYDYRLYEDAEYLLNIFDIHPELFTMPNTGDMYDYADKEEDTDDDWEEDDWEEEEEEEEEY